MFWSGESGPQIGGGRSGARLSGVLSARARPPDTTSALFPESSASPRKLSLFHKPGCLSPVAILFRHSRLRECDLPSSERLPFLEPSSVFYETSKIALDFLCCALLHINKLPDNSPRKRAQFDT